MNNDIEEIEAFLKPTKTKRRLIVVIQSISVALTLLLGFYLFKQIDYLDSINQNKYSWFIHAARGVVALRLLALVGTAYGGSSNNMILWTTSSSFIFISYFISGVMHVYVIVVATDLTTRVVSVLLMVGEVILNGVSFITAMIIAYQTLVTTQRKTSLDMEDPMQVFIATILKSILSILPGVGYFSEKLIRLTKME
ncbi:hypothetical protein WA171_004608 [Blastocystis sp. BT1]